MKMASRKGAKAQRGQYDTDFFLLFFAPLRLCVRPKKTPFPVTTSAFILAQAKLPEGFRPNAGPFDIPFLPLWVIISLTVLGTLLVVALIWWLRKRWKKAHTPPPPPRQIALNSLQALQPQIESEIPIEFTVQVAAILRKFVVGQYGIPATRQTSQEFLQSLTQSSSFSDDDQSLLKSFLDKSDLIEFAKLQATSDDNRELWEKARQFVQGGQP